MITPLHASILAPIEKLLREVLIWLHDTAGLPWAWAIIALTALVRLAIFPLTAKQTRSSLAMQRLQPYLKQLQSKYKDDRTALNQAMMEFYRDNKVNPLASCLPLLIQLPIFFALFFVLKHFADTGATGDFSFMFGFVEDIRQWINNDDGDITKNSYGAGWILLLVYVGSQMLSTVTMMTSPNPTQKWLFLAMPLLFVPFILKFPIGVMLYWITTNLWSLFQYLLIVRFSKADAEIILPADSKGRKKAVTPKGEKKGAGGQDSGSQTSKAAPARRNKRRR